ncbi:MAG: M1 family metallopeptidase [Methanoregulaceae archaeon]|nr:M1 family metallopeptidase [Methanoregulaceae archaeon]
MQRLFHYYPSDFGEIPVKVIHMDLVFEVFDNETRVSSNLFAESKDRPLAALELNAKDLEILAVACTGRAVSWEYSRERSILVLTFAEPVPPGTRFTVITETTCRPSRTTLEGLYLDETPPGAPPQQITQCQQWGFQRLVPCIDDMTAKCTYTTTIIADERYTNLISNGDVIEPRRPAGPGRVSIRYANTLTPMAPYLFFLCCGTYTTFSREFEYPDGNTFQLELLVPPGSDPAIGGEALDILSEGVLWVHLFTGPEAYDDLRTRQEVLALVRERDRRKAEGAGPEILAGIRERLKTLVRTIRTGYTYTGTVYREIGMQNSNFGGMENVGNTTISTNRIMPFPEMTDRAFEYMVDVKVHEFYHNLNGSEVTGASPFELWLNEAVTVYIEQEYHGTLFGESYNRLGTVLGLLAPAEGVLSLDAGAASLPIVPDGFNDPNDLITGITYVKGPEFVRMIATMAGRESFMRGLGLYYSRHRHGNATTSDWIRAMEEVTGRAFADMAQTWLKRTGYPVVRVRPEYDENIGTLTLSLTQSGFHEGRPWTFPFRIGLVDESGNDILDRILVISEETETVRLPAGKRPAFLSLNRGFSFYGKVLYDAPDEELLLQARSDRDVIGRFTAFSAFMDREKIRLLSNPDTPVSGVAVDLFGSLLSDHDLLEEAGAQFLTIFESVSDERYTHLYGALYKAREKILRAIAAQYHDRLLSLYNSFPGSGQPEFRMEERIKAIKDRQLKNAALALLARTNTPEIHELLRRQIAEPGSATDRNTAFALYLDSSAPDKIPVMGSFASRASRDLVAWEGFLSACGGASGDDAIDIVHRAERSAAFRIDQANDQRALYLRFARNRKVSLETSEGRTLLLAILRKLASVNEFSTVEVLQSFDAIDLMEERHQVPLVGILVTFLRELDPVKSPGLRNTIRRLLLGAPGAVARFEEVNGRIGPIQGDS